MSECPFHRIGKGAHLDLQDTTSSGCCSFTLLERTPGPAGMVLHRDGTCKEGSSRLVCRLDPRLDPGPSSTQSANAVSKTEITGPQAPVAGQESLVFGSALLPWGRHGKRSTPQLFSTRRLCRCNHQIQELCELCNLYSQWTDGKAT